MITIRTFTDDDYPAFVAVRNAAYPEYPVSVEEMRGNDAKNGPEIRRLRLLAEVDGLTIGAASYRNMPWMYHPQKFEVSVQVHPEYRRRGIGRRLYRHLLDDLARHEPLALRHTVREDMTDGLGFALRRGFVEEMRAWESRLDVAAFDPAPYAAHLAEVAGQGIAIRSVRELEARDPQFWPRFYALDNKLSVDVPAPEPYTPPSYEHWLKFFTQENGFLPDAYLIACDGDRYVGLTSLWHRASLSDLDTGLTAVRRDYRRRGIALALKLHAIAYARARGAPTIRTDNESNNRAMLSINEQLGFVKLPAWLMLVKELGPSA